MRLYFSLSFLVAAVIGCGQADRTQERRQAEAMPLEAERSAPRSDTEALTTLPETEVYPDRAADGPDDTADAAAYAKTLASLADEMMSLDDDRFFDRFDDRDLNKVPPEYSRYEGFGHGQYFFLGIRVINADTRVRDRLLDHVRRGDRRSFDSATLLLAGGGQDIDSPLLKRVRFYGKSPAGLLDWAVNSVYLLECVCGDERYRILGAGDESSAPPRVRARLSELDSRCATEQRQTLANLDAVLTTFARRFDAADFASPLVWSGTCEAEAVMAPYLRDYLRREHDPVWHVRLVRFHMYHVCESDDAIMADALHARSGWVRYMAVTAMTGLERRQQILLGVLNGTDRARAREASAFLAQSECLAYESATERAEVERRLRPDATDAEKLSVMEFVARISWSRMRHDCVCDGESAQPEYDLLDPRTLE